MKFNKNPYTLPKNYVFKAVREKAAEFKKTSGIKPIDLGVGDVKLPLFSETPRLSRVTRPPKDTCFCVKR